MRMSLNILWTHVLDKWLHNIYHVHIHYLVTLMLGPALPPCSHSYSKLHLSNTSVWPIWQVLGPQGIGLGGSTLLQGSHYVLGKLLGVWDCSRREGIAVAILAGRRGLESELPRIYEKNLAPILILLSGKKKKSSPAPPPNNVFTDPSETWTWCEHLTSTF